MKKLIMTLSIIAILALPGCCCKRSNAPKTKTHKKAVKEKHVAKKKDVVKKHKAAPKKKHHDKKKKKHAALNNRDAKHPKHVHIELDDTDALFA